MTKCQAHMLNTLFQANEYPEKEEIRRHAKSLCISERRLKSRLNYMRRKRKAEAALPGSEFINITHTNTHTQTNTHTHTHTHVT